MRTFDAKGRLLGDTLSPDEATLVSQAALDTGQASDTVNLPPMTVSVNPAAAGASLAQLLQPPYVYFIVGGIALATYLYSQRRRS
jgi:hypothetical protein